MPLQFRIDSSFTLGRKIASPGFSVGGITKKTPSRDWSDRRSIPAQIETKLAATQRIGARYQLICEKPAEFHDLIPEKLQRHVLRDDRGDYWIIGCGGTVAIFRLQDSSPNSSASWYGFLWGATSALKCLPVGQVNDGLRHAAAEVKPADA